MLSITLLLLFLCDEGALAGPPLFGDSAAAKFRTADAVVVARVTGLSSLQLSVPGLEPIHMPKGARMYPCQLDANVLKTLKGTTTGDLSIFWFHWKGCTKANWAESGVRVGESLVLYLTRQAGQWRPIADGPRTAAHRLLDKGEEVARLVQKETDPSMSLALALVYVDALVNPVGFTENWSHGGSSTSDVWDLVGLDNLVYVWDRVYRFADANGRQSICFLASDFGMCMACVARYLYANRDKDLWEPVISYRHELILKELGPSTIRGLEGSMGKKSNEVRQFLRFYSCNSNVKIRSRARYLLRVLFNQRQQPPCVPCDAG